MWNQFRFCLGFVLTAFSLFAVAPLHAKPASFVVPVVISEIHADPFPKTAHAEFVELHNPTPNPVAVSDWTLGGGIEYTFPSSAVIPANGYSVVAQNPRTIQERYNVSAPDPSLVSLLMKAKRSCCTTSLAAT